jgi:hypothetical protein
VKIDIYDSATPEPGYEDMPIAEIIAHIDDYEREQAAYEAEQEQMWRDFPWHNSANFGRF